MVITYKNNIGKKKLFWSDGYFVCSIGEASPDCTKLYSKSGLAIRFIPSAKDQWDFSKGVIKLRNIIVIIY